jgi:hypothetical protein
LNLSLSCSNKRFGCFDIPEEEEEEEEEEEADDCSDTSLHMSNADAAFNSQQSLPSLDSIQENDTLFGSEPRCGESSSLSSSFATLLFSGDSFHHHRTTAIETQSSGVQIAGFGNEVVQLCPVLPAVTERMAKKKILRWDTNNYDGSLDSTLTSIDQTPKLALRRESVESVDRNRLNIWICSSSIVGDQTPQMAIRKGSIILKEAPIIDFEGFHIDDLDHQDERQHVVPDPPTHIVTPPQNHRNKRSKAGEN